MWTRIACGVFSLPKKGWGGRRVETCSRSCLLIIQILTTPFPSSPAPLSPQLTPSFIYIWLILYLTLLLLFPCTCQSKIMMVIIEMMITIISAWSLLFMDVSVASRDHWWITEWQERERGREETPDPDGFCSPAYAYHTKDKRSQQQGHRQDHQWLLF